MTYVRIVQPKPEETRAARTQGTKVLLDDGSELEGVYKIVLTTEINSIWTAEIHCHPVMTDMTAMATIHRPSLWIRLKLWLSSRDVPHRGMP